MNYLQCCSEISGRHCFLLILLSFIQGRPEKSYQKHFPSKAHCSWNLTLHIVLMIIYSNPEAKVSFISLIYFTNSAEFTRCVHSACGYKTILIPLRSGPCWKECFSLPLALLSVATLWWGGLWTWSRWKLTCKKN